MNQRSVVILFALSTGLLQMSGCASQDPTIADEMRGAAAEVQSEADRRSQLADDWERGQSLLTSGQRKIERGEQRIERGQSEIEEGQAELREGRRLISESERQFEALRQQSP